MNAFRPACRLAALFALAGCGAPGSGPFAPSKDPEPFVPEPTLLDCDGKESVISQAVHGAASATWDAQLYIKYVPEADDRLFRKWFDSTRPPLSPLRADVGLCFERMHQNGFERGFKIRCNVDAFFIGMNRRPPCSVPRSQQAALPEAFTMAEFDDTVFLCPAWEEKPFGTRFETRMGTIVHEVSHWARTCNSVDETIDTNKQLSPEEAALLNVKPDRAVKNANNLQYFVEDWASSPHCSAAPGRRASGAGPTGIAGIFAMLLFFSNRRRRPSLCSFFALVLVSGCRTGAAVVEIPPPDLRVADSDLRCHLSLLRSEVGPGEPVDLRLEIENTGRKPILLSPNGTPLGGTLFYDVYRIIGPDGSRLRYIGFQARMGRGRPSWCSYLDLVAHARVGGTIDLTEQYRFPGPGEYRITWEGNMPAYYMHHKMPLQPPGNSVVHVTCPEVTVRIVEPEPSPSGSAPPRR